LKIRSRNALQKSVNAGVQIEYVFFWGHRDRDEVVSKACFSQWYEAKFTENGVEYLTAEHFMMAKKAELFGDLAAYQKIIKAANPGAAKSFGREVAGFDEMAWVDKRFAIVVSGNVLKFSQNKALAEFLLATGNKVLVEASPVDRIWGIGLAADDTKAENPNLWRGLNLLGFALMEVRDFLQKPSA
jgi:ribA/ribD-fused uncharacterized protein